MISSSLSPCRPIPDCINQLEGDALSSYRHAMKKKWKEFVSQHHPRPEHFVLRNIVMGYPLTRGFEPTRHLPSLTAGHDPWYAVQQALWLISAADPHVWQAFVDMDWTQAIMVSDIWEHPLLWREYLHACFHSIAVRG